MAEGVTGEPPELRQELSSS